MKKLSLLELNRPSLSEYKEVSKIPLIVILDNIRSANNVGSFFRTSDAFKIESIYLCGITAKPPHKEITKSAIGATKSVVWKYFEHTKDAIDDAREMNGVVLGIEQTDESVPLLSYQIDRNQRYALVFGNEVEGVSESAIGLLDDCIEIPQFGIKHSLNVSVCGGIVLHHFASEMM